VFDSCTAQAAALTATSKTAINGNTTRRAVFEKF
jgi:hypothetical protein